jgi:hypothetical protein
LVETQPKHLQHQDEFIQVARQITQRPTSGLFDHHLFQTGRATKTKTHSASEAMKMWSDANTRDFLMSSLRDTTSAELSTDALANIFCHTASRVTLLTSMQRDINKESLTSSIRQFVLLSTAVSVFEWLSHYGPDLCSYAATHPISCTREVDNIYCNAFPLCRLVQHIQKNIGVDGKLTKKSKQVNVSLALFGRLADQLKELDSEMISLPLANDLATEIKKLQVTHKLDPVAASLFAYLRRTFFQPHIESYSDFISVENTTYEKLEEQFVVLGAVALAFRNAFGTTAIFLHPHIWVDLIVAPHKVFDWSDTRRTANLERCHGYFVALSNQDPKELLSMIANAVKKRAGKFANRAIGDVSRVSSKRVTRILIPIFLGRE